MNPIPIIIYTVGVLIAAFFIRLVNSKQKCIGGCVPPVFCLFSLLTVVVITMFYIGYLFNEKFNAFFNYTDKE